MSPVWSFAFLRCFESLAAGAPTEEGKKEQGMQLCQPTGPNASWILSILSHFHASLAIQPRTNESHIMSEDRCQKSLNLLGSNDLKYRREFSHSMPKRHRHRMSKKWSIITVVIKFELMTKRQNWPLPCLAYIISQFGIERCKITDHFSRSLESKGHVAAPVRVFSIG